jgi:predicted nucleic acid-binding protein
MIVLDASVVIAHFGRDDVHARRAFDVLDTEDELLLHPLTLAEVLTRPVRGGQEYQTLALLENIGIDRWLPDLDEPLRIARLRATTKLKLPDCCVLSAAMATGGAIATFDAALAAEAQEAGLAVVDS